MREQKDEMIASERSKQRQLDLSNYFTWSITSKKFTYRYIYL
jgi:hypothetical protein